MQVIEDALPVGWISLVDPASGMTYYANEVTGVTTWDRPRSIPSTVPHSTSGSSLTSSNPQNSAPLQGQKQAPVIDSIAPAAAKLAAKYGDGFVTSASHPELAEQYGNIGTSNPYADARPGTAIVKKVEKAPVSGTPFDQSHLAAVMSPEDKVVTDGLLAFVSWLTSIPLATTDQKLLIEADKSIAIFVKRLAKQDISRDVVDKVKNMWHALESRDFNAANTIQNGLVNSEWREHKDWIKGLKFLIQIAAKYMQ